MSCAPTDCDGLLDRLEHRAAIQREHRRYPVLSQHRIDPDLADPWAPEVVLVEQELSAVQRARLSAVINTEPKVTLGGRGGRDRLQVLLGRCVAMVHQLSRGSY